MNKAQGKTLATAAALLGMTGTAVLTASLPARATGNLMTSTDKMFVVKAAQGGLAEVMASKLALSHTSNKNVLMVAHRMIKEHGVANADLKQTTMKIGVMAPNHTDPMHMAMYAKLSRLHGAAFDKAYMRGQVKDHDMTVALFKTEIEKGQESPIRGFAAKYLPTIQDHTIMIHNVAANLGADPSAHKSKKMNMHMKGM